MKKEQAYATVLSQFQGVLTTPGLSWDSALVSLIALLKEHISAISWVGFYRKNKQGDLWIGPYQGKLACLYLKFGQGVCGAALASEKTIVVPDVHEFEGHVACDALSRSEIVVPVYHQKTLVGVLDLDSYEPAAFDGTDQKHLESLLKSIERLEF